MQEALTAEFPQINHISLQMFVWNSPSLWPLFIHKPLTVLVNEAPIRKGEPATWWHVGLLQPAGTLSQQIEMKVHCSYESNIWCILIVAPQCLHFIYKINYSNFGRWHIITPTIIKTCALILCVAKDRSIMVPAVQIYDLAHG